MARCVCLWVDPSHGGNRCLRLVWPRRQGGVNVEALTRYAHVWAIGAHPSLRGIKGGRSKSLSIAHPSFADKARTAYNPRMEKPENGIGKLVLIIGPSGVGKSVVMRYLRTHHPEFHFPRSSTTRARRQGEGDENYHFVTNAEFDALVGEHKFVEWAIVHGKDRYGTMLDEIVPYIEQGKTVVREIDVQGFVSIQNSRLFHDGKHPVQSIFILPESKEQVIAHIKRRAPISDDELHRRVHSMDKELAYADHCDERVLNVEGKLDDTVKEVERLILG